MIQVRVFAVMEPNNTSDSSADQLGGRPVDVKPGSNVQSPVVGCSLLMSMNFAPEASCREVHCSMQSVFRLAWQTYYVCILAELHLQKRQLYFCAVWQDNFGILLFCSIVHQARTAHYISQGQMQSACCF